MRNTTLIVTAAFGSLLAVAFAVTALTGGSSQPDTDQAAEGAQATTAAQYDAGSRDPRSNANSYSEDAGQAPGWAPG
ncbi:MAG: hypothetical protein ACREUU_01325, partial [Gammaproteobacteria bacterium]